MKCTNAIPRGVHYLGRAKNTADHLKRAHRLAEHAPRQSRRNRGLGEDHDRDETDGTAADRDRGEALAEGMRDHAEKRDHQPAARVGRDHLLAAQPSRGGQRDRGDDRGTEGGAGAVETRAHRLDEHEICRVSGGRREGEGVAEADPRRRQHARHDPGPEQREAQSRPDPSRRPLAEEQRAARDRQNGRDIADERGIGDFRARQRDMKSADIDGESEAGEKQGQGEAAEIGAVGPTSRAEPRPQGKHRRRQPQAPRAAGERADVEKPRQDARPGYDRGSDEQRDPTGPIRAHAGARENRRQGRLVVRPRHGPVPARINGRSLTCPTGSDGRERRRRSRARAGPPQAP
jgi:hypothetical protein